jgi:hypothetical protein
MKLIPIIATILIASSAAAQTPNPQSDPFRRPDGQPTDKVLLKASQACHAHNPDAAEAKENCAVFDAQIIKRTTEVGVSAAIRNRADELSK